MTTSVQKKDQQTESVWPVNKAEYYRQRANNLKSLVSEMPERETTATSTGADNPTATSMAGDESREAIKRSIPQSSKLFEAQPTDSFIALQKWQGIVLRVTSTTFRARLIDQTRPNPEEEAEFSKDEISPDDLRLLEPGAIFYWSIGYLDKKSGQRIRESVILFRRLPAWTEKELKEAEVEARELKKYFE